MRDFFARMYIDGRGKNSGSSMSTEMMVNEFTVEVGGGCLATS